MKLDNFKIRRLDKWNITFAEYREVECKSGEKQMQWVESGRYYSTLESCLDAIKKHIINSYVDIEDYQEVLDNIEKLNNCIVKCNLKAVEENLEEEE